MIDLAQQIIKTLLIGGLILYLMLGVVRPTLKRINQPQALQLGEQVEDGVAQVIPAVTHAPQVLQREENMALARRLAQEDPKLVANVVRQWMAVNE